MFIFHFVYNVACVLLFVHYDVSALNVLVTVTLYFIRFFFSLNGRLLNLASRNNSPQWWHRIKGKEPINKLYYLLSHFYTTSCLHVGNEIYIFTSWMLKNSKWSDHSLIFVLISLFTTFVLSLCISCLSFAWIKTTKQTKTRYYLPRDQE